MRLLLLALAFLAGPVAAQTIRATTEEGRPVLLRRDGTWVYEGNEAAGTSETRERRVVERPEEATQLVRGDRRLYGVWHTDEWRQEAEVDNEDADFGLEHESEALYALAISERTPFPLEVMRDIALRNAEDAASDVHLVFEEPRTVNGADVLYIEFEGMLEGAVSITFQVTFYSDDRGTVQFMTWTATQLLDEVGPAIEALHRGIVVFED